MAGDGDDVVAAKTTTVRRTKKPTPAAAEKTRDAPAANAPAANAPKRKPGGKKASSAAAAAAAASAAAAPPEEDRRKTSIVSHEVPQRASLIDFLATRAGLSPVQARDAEVGVYNWALARAEARRIARNWRNPKFRALYEAKARSVAANLDPASYVANDRLVARLSDLEFTPHEIASMTPEHVFPERWREVVEMKVRRDEYISNAKPTAMTDQFKCQRCKNNECSYMELQTRSCDEPATLFIQCLTCGHRWRMG